MKSLLISDIIKNMLLAFIPVVFLFSCKEDLENEDAQCKGDIICTENFVTVNLEIVDNSNAAVQLDDYYTLIESGTQFKIDKSESNPLEGIYPVASDAQLNLLSFEGTVLTFVGVIDNQNVVEHQMTIGKDCCHIQLVEGEDRIIINL